MLFVAETFQMGELVLEGAHRHESAEHIVQSASQSQVSRETLG